jgi:hypothetical protein
MREAVVLEKKFSLILSLSEDEFAQSTAAPQLLYPTGNQMPWISGRPMFGST